MANETRQRLIEAAAELFHEQGFTATGVAAITERAQSGAGSFYHFFASKEELLLAVLDHYEVRLKREIAEPSLAASPDPVERVLAILGFYRQFLRATDYRLGCPIGNLAGEVADSHPPVRAKIARLFTAWQSAVVACFEDAPHALPPEVDARSLAAFVLSVMEGAVMQARVFRHIAPFEATFEHLKRYLEDIVRTHEEVRP